jgi:uncharacterized protein YfdQ (DUF2303 family)
MIPVETLNKILEMGCLDQKANTSHSGTPFVIVPVGMKVESLAPLMPLDHIKRTVALDDAASFIAYVNLYKDEDTLILCRMEETKASFKAILDYHHTAGAARYCDHVATYATAVTKEWATWMEANRKPFGQVEFATWLEDNAPLFTKPNGAELLELVRTLHAKSEVRYTGAVRLQTGGGSLHYDEDVTVRGSTATQCGCIELPPIVTVGISPFIGSPSYEISARLKYKVGERKLQLWFETIRPHVIVRDSVKLICDQIAQGTEFPLLQGAT